MVWSTSLRPNTSQGFNENQTYNFGLKQMKSGSKKKSPQKENPEPQTA